MSSPKTSADPWNLERFVLAQQGSYDGALAELRRGRKTGHWIWYVFPQIAGLGMSGMSQRYGISGLDEARAYLDHPVLGARLVTCAEAVDAHAGTSAEAMLGGIDAIKLRSSMTLFKRIGSEHTIFAAVLDHFYDGREDDATLRLLT